MELCRSFGVIFGLFVASLNNSLLAWSVSFGGKPSLGRFVVVSYYFHFLIMDLNCAPWDVQSFRSFFITQPWSVLLQTLSLTSLENPWSSRCRLLSGVAGPEDFQNRCMYIYWDNVTLRLHTGGLYLINYVTSECNWLHQILFRGFIAKGVKTYACTTFRFYFLEFWSYFFIFYFSSPILTILCMSITWNLNKNLFKLQVVMQ